MAVWFSPLPSLADEQIQHISPESLVALFDSVMFRCRVRTHSFCPFSQWYSSVRTSSIFFDISVHLATNELQNVDHGVLNT